MISFTRIRVAAALVCGAAACSGADETVETPKHEAAAASSGTSGAGGGGVGGGGGAGEGGFMPGPHAPFPQIPDLGGDKLDAVHVVSINYAGTKYASDVEAFGSWIVGSEWFTNIGGEYGFGAGTHEQRLLAGPPPATLSALGGVEFIGDHVASGELPPPTAETLYIVYVPPETMLTSLAGGCDGGNAYPSAFHDSGDLDGVPFSYAMVPICGETSLEWLETGAGHEIVEAVTDARPLTNPAYQFPQGNPWRYLMGEVADLCEALPSATVDAYTVPRIWSNETAKSNDRWPCLPTPDGPYFGVTASEPLVHVAAGQSADLTFTAWSTAPGEPWTIEAMTQPVFDGVTFTPQFSIDKTTLANGDHLTATVTVPASAPPGSQSVFIVLSRSGAVATFWPVLLEVQ